MKNKKNIAVGLSGGVDSSVAALLLLEQGHCVVGLTMAIYDGSMTGEESGKHACYGPGEEEDIEKSSAVCKKLGIPYHVIDLREEYRRHVIGYFRGEYLAGRTPNPCVVCNRMLKFGFLLEKAASAGISFDRFATGHYARVERTNDRYILKRAVDKTKDQSYFLYSLAQQQLSTSLFPLGSYTKSRVREIARSSGLETADRVESQDFISGDYTTLFDKNEVTEGEIMDEFGRVLGRHRGIIHYTIGQRKGLGIAAGRPVYVTDIDAVHNRIIVSDRESLLSKGLVAGEPVFIPFEALDRPLEVIAKIRFNHKGIPAKIHPVDNGKVKVMFEKPQHSVSPGQSVVFYQDDTVVGGGIIERPI